MKKRGTDATANPSAAVGAGDAGMVKLLMTLKGRGRGKRRNPQMYLRKPK